MDRKNFFDASKYKAYLISNNEKVRYIFENFFIDKWKKKIENLIIMFIRMEYNI